MRELIITEGRSAAGSLIMPQFCSIIETKKCYIRIKICKWKFKLLDTKNVQKQIKLKRKIAAAELRLLNLENNKLKGGYLKWQI